MEPIAQSENWADSNLVLGIDKTFVAPCFDCQGGFCPCWRIQKSHRKSWFEWKPLGPRVPKEDAMEDLANCSNGWQGCSPNAYLGTFRRAYFFKLYMYSLKNSDMKSLQNSISEATQVAVSQATLDNFLQNSGGFPQAPTLWARSWPFSSSSGTSFYSLENFNFTIIFTRFY